jgi:hypothetical protein
VGRTGSAVGMSCGLRFWPLATFIGRRGDGTRLQCHDTATGVDLRAERTGDGPLDISERMSTAPHALPRDGLAFPGDRHEGNRRLAARGSAAVGGVTRKIRMTTLTRGRVLNTFKCKVRAQRDCDSLCK